MRPAARAEERRSMETTVTISRHTRSCSLELLNELSCCLLTAEVPRNGQHLCFSRIRLRECNTVTLIRKDTVAGLSSARRFLHMGPNTSLVVSTGKQVGLIVIRVSLCRSRRVEINMFRQKNGLMYKFPITGLELALSWP